MFCNLRKIILPLWVSGFLSNISIEQDYIKVIFLGFMDELTSVTFLVGWTHPSLSIKSSQYLYLDYWASLVIVSVRLTWYILFEWACVAPGDSFSFLLTVQLWTTVFAGLLRDCCTFSQDRLTGRLLLMLWYYEDDSVSGRKYHILYLSELYMALVVSALWGDSHVFS